MSESESQYEVDAVARHVLELVAPLGPATSQPLLGTYGLYLEDRIFGLVQGGVVYFRTDEETAPHYVEAGSEPLRYRLPSGWLTEPAYYEVPMHVLTDRDLMCAWAYEAAART